MKKHYTYKTISDCKKKILEALLENEKSGLSFKEIMDKVKEEKELILTSIDELFNYNCLVSYEDDKYYFRA